MLPDLWTAQTDAPPTRSLEIALRFPQHPQPKPKVFQPHNQPVHQIGAASTFRLEINPELNAATPAPVQVGLPTLSDTVRRIGAAHARCDGSVRPASHHPPDSVIQACSESPAGSSIQQRPLNRLLSILRGASEDAEVGQWSTFPSRMGVAAKHGHEPVAVTRCLFKQRVPSRLAGEVREVFVAGDSALVPARFAKGWYVG